MQFYAEWFRSVVNLTHYTVLVLSYSVLTTYKYCTNYLCRVPRNMPR